MSSYPVFDDLQAHNNIARTIMHHEEECRHTKLLVPSSASTFAYAKSQLRSVQSTTSHNLDMVSFFAAYEDLLLKPFGAVSLENPFHDLPICHVIACFEPRTQKIINFVKEVAMDGSVKSVFESMAVEDSWNGCGSCLHRLSVLEDEEVRKRG
ncbi:hypothetical protein SADUNF_Sadunf16G0117200 [Salix dunnii]|uniref:Uncharacterized protein n=1 Tax=Salix dunnii TaxID=1413687 RepID=A0A835J9E4_9ROSI|nr:hypothetical protein SADUNF_Sadunf16G0117200 [Salix dunnii]